MAASAMDEQVQLAFQPMRHRVIPAHGRRVAPWEKKFKDDLE
jgi:hypothetical protein